MADRVPLHYPLYGASFGEAVGRYFRKYATFTGRASRSEFWWAQLFLGIVYTAASFVAVGIYAAVVVAIVAPSASTGENPSGAIAGTVVGATFALYGGLFVLYLPLLLPTLAVTVRRLHDAGFTGLFYLLALIPGGSLAVVVLCILDSRPEGMRYDVAPAPPTAVVSP